MAPSARDRIVFPLDVSSLDEAQDWLVRLGTHVGVYKVGLELFTAVGPAAVEAVHDAGAGCFLDLKLHDIPATVASAVRSAASLGVRYLTLHASAGPAALAAAVEAAHDTGTQLLAVTVLTSFDQEELDAIGLAGAPAEAVSRLARVAHDSGVDGFVCSPREVAALREQLGMEATLVVPGVRPKGTATGDQRRTATPAEARAAGADLLVIGRPIRLADDPVAAARAIADEIAS